MLIVSFSFLVASLCLNKLWCTCKLSVLRRPAGKTVFIVKYIFEIFNPELMKVKIILIMPKIDNFCLVLVSGSCVVVKHYLVDCEDYGDCLCFWCFYQGILWPNYQKKKFGDHYFYKVSDLLTAHQISDQHKTALQDKPIEGHTTLSTHLWKQVEAGWDPTLSWKVVESNIPIFNPVTKTCRLCLREKFNIVLNPHLATLNCRQEMFAHCRQIITKLIGKKPPDWP